MGLFDGNDTQNADDAQARADAEAVARMREQQARYAEEQAEAQARAAAEAPAPAPAEPEAAPAEQYAAPEPQYREHTVVRGDTLSAIGKKYGVKWRDIAALNDIKNPDLIHPGQVFRIPNA